MIYALSGDDLGIERGESYVLSEWRGRGRVVFSATQKGKAMECHFSLEKKALRDLTEACEDYIEWVFEKCKWCTMIITAIDKPSIKRFVERLGFVAIANCQDNKQIFMRVR